MKLHQKTLALLTIALGIFVEGKPAAAQTQDAPIEQPAQTNQDQCIKAVDLQALAMKCLSGDCRDLLEKAAQAPTAPLRTGTNSTNGGGDDGSGHIK